MTVYVFGHINPDSDSIVSAIAATELLKARGIDAVACKQGDVNPESKFILEKFGLKTPETITSVEGKNIALVDTTELTQLPSDIDKATVVFVADHHKLGGLKTAMPLEVYGQPVGCAATVLTNIFKCFLLVPVSKNKSSISSWISLLSRLERITTVLLPLIKDNSLTKFGPTADHSRIT